MMMIILTILVLGENTAKEVEFKWLHQVHRLPESY